MKKFNLKKAFSRFAEKITKKVRKDADGSFRNRLINVNTSLHVMEAYRMARTNLMYTAKGAGVRVFGVTSAAPHDGKSLTCANLAISFAMAGKKVLLVDCDMHRPTQNVSFGVTIENGLSEYLTGICEEAEIAETEYENVHLLSAGRCPPDPSELLQSDRLASLLVDAKTKYDCVFFDLPPLNVISDATVIASHLDGYVFVVRAKQSDRFDVQNAVDSIKHVEGKVLGFILNDMEHHSMSGYSTRYYSRYYYSRRRNEKSEGDSEVALDTAKTEKEASAE